MQDLRVLASTSQPSGDGSLSVAENPFDSRWVQPFSQRRQDHADVGRGRFQTIQRGMAARPESGVARLAAKGLDLLGAAMLAVPDKCMDVSIGDPAVRALLIGTGEAFGVHSLGCPPPAFHLTPGAYWCSGRSQTGGAEATEGAIKRGACLEKTVDQSASPLCL